MLFNFVACYTEKKIELRHILQYIYILHNETI
jgi:hypothetical protein